MSGSWSAIEKCAINVQAIEPYRHCLVTVLLRLGHKLMKSFARVATFSVLHRRYCKSPKTITPVGVPTYTLPFAIVGRYEFVVRKNYRGSGLIAVV